MLWLLLPVLLRVESDLSILQPDDERSESLLVKFRDRLRLFGKMQPNSVRIQQSDRKVLQQGSVPRRKGGRFVGRFVGREGGREGGGGGGGGGRGGGAVEATRDGESWKIAAHEDIVSNVLTLGCCKAMSLRLRAGPQSIFYVTDFKDNHKARTVERLSPPRRCLGRIRGKNDGQGEYHHNHEVWRDAFFD